MTKNSAYQHRYIAQDAAERSERKTHNLINSKPMAGGKIMKRMSTGEHMKMYWDFFFGSEETRPVNAVPIKKLDAAAFYSAAGAAKSVWLGHSSLLLNIEGCIILTDPVFQRKISPVGPTSFHQSLALDAEQLVHVDVVIISHDHYDHLNKYSIEKLKEITTIFVVPEGVGDRLLKWGVPRRKIVELGWWQEYVFADTLVIAATPAQHFSGRGLFDRNRTLWASWVVKTENHNVFFSGDTGYFKGFQKIGEKYGPFDIAYLECGAYNEGWPNVHMFPEQTIQAYFDLGASVLQPVHWGTFNLSLHAWYEPVERLITSAWSRGVRLSIPMIGEVVDSYSKELPQLWWQQAVAGKKDSMVTQLLTADMG